MAAPIVAGIAGLMIDRDRSLTPGIFKARRMKTARRGMTKTVSLYEPSTAQTYNLTRDIFTIGAGIVDAWAAFNNTERPTGSAASPRAAYNSSTKKVSLDFAATGGTNITWGTSTFSSDIVLGCVHRSGGGAVDLGQRRQVASASADAAADGDLPPPGHQHAPA